MKRLLIALVVIVILACAAKFMPLPTPGIVLYAQTLPYTITVAWDAPTDGSATAYKCFLDGVVAVASVTTLTCAFPISTLGPHIIGVASLNPTFIPSESLPATLAITLKTPSAPRNVRVQ